MIAAQELRIGNWLKYNDLPITVSGISSTNFTCTYKGLLYMNMEDCQSIELSPEILDKCGFENLKIEMSGCQVWNIPNTHWRIAMSYRDEICFKLWHKQVSPPTWLLSEFLYLHQLQNLYYCLVGQELQINL